MRQRSNLALENELRESDNDGLKRPKECKNRIHGVLFDTATYYMVNGQDERFSFRYESVGDLHRISASV